MQQVQRSLLIGALIGIIFGCVIGAGLVGLYIRQNPPVYSGGAYPNELTQNYQDHYLAMVIDSYVVNRQADVATERLKTFDDATQIRTLGRWSAIYVAGGRAAEAQAVNELAAAMNQSQGWSPETISAVVGQLATEFKDDSAKAQAINTYAAALGQVPAAEPPEAQPEQAAEPEAAPAPAAPSGGILRWQTGLLCCLGLILILLIAFVLYRRLARSRGPAKPETVWEGEGPPPIKSWSATYVIGQDNYDEQINIETPEGLLAGGVGVGISEAVSNAIIPGSSPKQVTAFDVWVFDKTDITNYAKVVMSEQAYGDASNQAAIEADAQAEAILAEVGKDFSIDTTAMRVEAKIEALEYGGGDTAYFDKLVVKMDIFLKEGIDLEKPMPIPDQYKS
jgi:hypothetical protein